jgi:hypothetical protein
LFRFPKTNYRFHGKLQNFSGTFTEITDLPAACLPVGRVGREDTERASPVRVYDPGKAGK